MKRFRSTIAAAALLAVAVPALQGCFPVIATGVGAGALMISDRRTTGTYIEDQGIEVKAESRITERLGDKVHVNVTSYDRVVLLTGEAPTEALKAEVEKIVTDLPNVKSVWNELQIAAPSSLAKRSNDTFITSKVKARFVEASRFAAKDVKVVTESGTVYLLGMVTQREAEAATELARTTSGVQRVVRLFENIDEEQARQIDARPPESSSGAAQAQ